jgi:competence protein ComEC
VIGAGLALSPIAARPDILIERTASNVALRTGEGTLVPAASRRGRFAVEAWLAADGDAASLRDAARRPGWSCAGDVCRAEIQGKRILYVHEGKTPASFGCDADILIADFPLRGRCRQVSLRIDRFDVWRSGAHALHFDGAEVIVKTARAEQGRRPWVIRPTPRKRHPLAAADWRRQPR